MEQCHCDTIEKKTLFGWTERRRREGGATSNAYKSRRNPYLGRLQTADSRSKINASHETKGSPLLLPIRVQHTSSDLDGHSAFDSERIQISDDTQFLLTVVQFESGQSGKIRG